MFHACWYKACRAWRSIGDNNEGFGLWDRKHCLLKIHSAPTVVFLSLYDYLYTLWTSNASVDEPFFVPNLIPLQVLTLTFWA